MAFQSAFFYCPEQNTQGCGSESALILGTASWGRLNKGILTGFIPNCPGGYWTVGKRRGTEAPLGNGAVEGVLACELPNVSEFHDLCASISADPEMRTSFFSLAGSFRSTGESCATLVPVATQLSSVKGHTFSQCCHGSWICLSGILA